MGVPKFFRYMSERYPCLSELIREYQIPEFDNMYLDMNGIIHMCSHPDDNDPHFRITEEKIFQDVFHYIDVLFRMIRPQKLFFMAIDGVAPRAKMNQQRGRRFRAAKDAEKQEREAKKRGELLPTEARFDSNCITPGTVFMARLHEQLKYFCVDKMSNDPLWTNVKIVLSGHETPGEGEHKIMDYIRYLRSQPGYDPNTRHCLYGLDADLIMLGLCTHEPHFSLLREEVKFGKKSTKRQSVPEEITFFLLHLSLMREYLELEFAPVKNKLVGFGYDFEKIIDDWVLMGFLVGNDFIPHLPNLHIANGALPILYNAYMEVLPTLDGYINEAGTLNLARFEKFMQRLADFDLENFDEVRDDITYMESKTGRKFNPHSKVSTDYDLEKWQPEEGTGNNDDKVFGALEPETNSNTRDSGLEALIQATEELDVTSDEEDDIDHDEEQAFKDYKKEYYMNKLEYAKVTPEVLRSQAEGYVRAIQWNLNYYYNGVCSWSWYYPHHYAPYISDIKGFSNLKIEFELGTPFKPYEQLLGVLPTASKELLPKAYHQLMTAEESPISKYYPDEFQTDLNGKRQDWEAVVLIPFMDEKLLLKAMEVCNENLSDEEKRRNTHGPMLIYSYTEKDTGVYKNPLDCFPPVKHNHSLVTPVSIEDIRVPKEKLIKGPYPGATMDVYYPGFPTFKHLEYTGKLKKAKVRVFEQPSRYESMIIQLASTQSVDNDIPVDLIGAEVFVGWPHLIEGRILAISNKDTKYVSMGSDNQYNSEDIEDEALFRRQASEVSERYKNRLGIEVGNVSVVCHVQVMTGRKFVSSPNGRLTMQKQFSEMTANYPLQTIVRNIKVHDPHMALFRDIQDVFPEGSVCFTLSNPYYGCQGIVLDSRETKVTGRIKVCVGTTNEPDFDDAKIMKTEILRSYKTLTYSSNQLGMGQLMYSRITGSIYVVAPNGEGGLKHTNLGLDLKMNKKNKETPGYTKKIGTIWYYTDKCTALVREYSDKFPEVFRFFSCNEAADQVNIEDIFENWEERLKELQQWLKSIPTHALKRLPCGSYITEPEVIQKIEEVVDEYLETITSKKITMTVKPAFLYKPEIQSGTLPPDPKMEVRLFDRIVNVRKGFSVPFGLKGTVTAISQPESKSERDIMYDVVFDKPFKDGLQLDCSAGRGYRLPRTAFIDITYGQRVLEEKTGKSVSVKDLLERAQKPNKFPWQIQNGQKFFNQLTKDTPTQRSIPDQYAYSDSSTERAEEASAFASFNNKNKMIVRGAPDEMGVKPTRLEKKAIKVSADRSNRTRTTESKSSSVPLKKAQPYQTDNFFPSFPSSEASKKSENVVNKKEIPARATSDNTCVVDTMFLKNLLKITTDANKTSSTSSKSSASSASINNQPVSNLSFNELIKNIDNTPPSTRLLTYYQSNNMGLPRYNYFSSGDNFKAQLMLNTGEVVIGDAAPTKEEATDSVAVKVLDLLLKKPISMVENTLPPKVWVDTAKGQSKGVPKTVIPSQFVPTQVIKRQSSVGNAGNVSQGTSDKGISASKGQEKSNGSIRNEAKKMDGSSKSLKKKRTRIAANFSNK